jgi:hypothetical protein
VGPLVANFYELPRDRVDDLRAAARATWPTVGRDGARWPSTLDSLRRPVPRYESPGYCLAAVLGVVGDTPLPDGEEMLADAAPSYEDLLTDLVECRGGGWTIIEPSAGRIAALDPAAFDAERLRAHYAGEIDYYPDGDDGVDEPGLIGTVLERLFPETPERVPADTGEQMLRDIELLRMVLSQIRPDSVLLIQMP